MNEGPVPLFQLKLIVTFDKVGSTVFQYMMQSFHPLLVFISLIVTINENYMILKFVCSAHRNLMLVEVTKWRIYTKLICF
jgi:hypothetical protein